MASLETTGIITDLNIDFNTSKPKITVLLDTNNKEVVEELKNDEKLNISLKKYKVKQNRNLCLNSSEGGKQCYAQFAQKSL